jgi:hypothetical protein
MALNHEVAGARGLGWVFRGHPCDEDGDVNSPVRKTTTDDDERRPATNSNGGSARVNVSDGAPAVFGG